MARRKKGRRAKSFMDFVVVFFLLLGNDEQHTMCAHKLNKQKLVVCAKLWWNWTWLLFSCLYFRSILNNVQGIVSSTINGHVIIFLTISKTSFPFFSHFFLVVSLSAPWKKKYTKYKLNYRFPPFWNIHFNIALVYFFYCFFYL